MKGIRKAAALEGGCLDIRRLSMMQVPKVKVAHLLANVWITTLEWHPDKISRKMLSVLNVKSSTWCAGAA